MDDMGRHIERLRRLINIMGLTREECYLQVMTGDRPPSEEDFGIAYDAALVMGNTDYSDKERKRRDCPECNGKGYEYRNGPHCFLCEGSCYDPFS